MEKTAANDTVLLAQAQQRVQSMLEDYVKNMGTMLGKEYTICLLYTSDAADD